MPSPPLHGRVASPDPFDWPGAASTVPGHGGFDFGAGCWTGAVVGAGVGGAAVGGAVVGGAAVGGVEAGPAVGDALVGAALVATATGPGPGVSPGAPDEAGWEDSGVSPGARVGSVTGGCDPVGSPLGLGEPPAIGGALADGEAVTRAV